MPQETIDDLPPHIRDDVARKDAMVLDLCERLGFDYVMVAAARLWAAHDPAAALGVGAKRRKARTDEQHAGLDECVGRLRVDARLPRVRETLEQIQSFADATRGRSLSADGRDAPASITVEGDFLVVDRLRLRIKDIRAGHGRSYSQPYDEARTRHSLGLHDASGSSVELRVSGE